MRGHSTTSKPAVRTQVQPGLWLDSRLALWIAEERLLIVADLHWGYTASHRARGHLLPIWGDDEIEGRLNSLLTDYDPAELIWLGDCVHAAEGGPRAEAFVRRTPTPITRVAGNHDRRWAGAVERSVTRGRFFLHHGDGRFDVPSDHVEITGHHHPAMEWSDGAGSRLKCPALVSSPHRLILPAFSPWAGGTAWNQHLTPEETLWAISPARIFPFEPGRPARTALS